MVLAVPLVSPAVMRRLSVGRYLLTQGSAERTVSTLEGVDRKACCSGRAPRVALSTAPPFPVIALGKGKPVALPSQAPSRTGLPLHTGERTKLVLASTMRASINT